MTHSLWRFGENPDYPSSDSAPKEEHLNTSVHLPNMGLLLLHPVSKSLAAFRDACRFSSSFFFTSSSWLQETRASSASSSARTNFEKSCWANRGTRKLGTTASPKPDKHHTQSHGMQYPKNVLMGAEGGGSPTNKSCLLAERANQSRTLGRASA